MNHRLPFAILFGAIAGFATPSLADFSGQIILGPLTAGSAVSGNTTGHADDNDGFDSGGHFFDIWDGGDDVWQLNWGGGDLVVSLFNTGAADNDLFLYVPGSLDSTEHSSVFPGPMPDVITILGAAAGTYYINVDTESGSEGAYNLTVGQIPGPGASALMGAVLLLNARRRRR